MKNFETFCVQPWASQEYGLEYSNICCWIKKTNQDQNLREDLKQSLANGKKHSACNLCWDCEARGESSRRLQKNMLADVIYDLDLTNLYYKAIAGELDGTFYQVETSNVCNGCCVTCGPRVSSKWGKVEGLDTSLKEIDNFHIDYKQAKFVEFIGGEPFLDKINLEIMNSLINAGNLDCIISITTNGSIYSKKHMELLKKFRKVIICYSIDGVDKTFDYLRWPLEWKSVEKNMRRIKQELNLPDISVNCTLSNIGKVRYEETIAYFEKNNYKYFITPVKDPIVFAYNRPIDILTLEELKRQDRLKSISYKDYIPELEKYF